MSLPTWAVTAATWTWVIIGALGVLLAVSMACQWIAAEVMRHLRIWRDFVGFVGLRVNGLSVERLQQESFDARSTLTVLSVKADKVLRDIDTWGHLVRREMATRPWSERPDNEKYNEVVWNALPEWLRALPQPESDRDAEEVVISLRHLVMTLREPKPEAQPPKGPAS